MISLMNYLRKRPHQTLQLVLLHILGVVGNQTQDLPVDIGQPSCSQQQKVMDVWCHLDDAHVAAKTGSIEAAESAQSADDMEKDYCQQRVKAGRKFLTLKGILNPNIKAGD